MDGWLRETICPERNRDTRPDNLTDRGGLEEDRLRDGDPVEVGGESFEYSKVSGEPGMLLPARESSENGTRPYRIMSGLEATAWIVGTSAVVGSLIWGGYYLLSQPGN